MTDTLRSSAGVPSFLPLAREDLARHLGKLGKPDLIDIIGSAQRVAQPNESIMIVGSLALGLGNRSSDIDLLIINPGEPDRPNGPFQFFVDDERIEIIRVAQTPLRATVDDLARRLDAGQPIGLGQERERLLSRVAHGAQVAGAPVDAEFEAHLATVWQRAILRRTRESVRKHALVAALAVDQGDDLVASWNGRGAVEAVLQLGALRAGLPYAGAKWLYEQLRGRPELAAATELLRLPRTPAERHAHTAACLAEAATALGTGTGLAELGADARWDGGGLHSRRLFDRSVLVNTEHNTVHELTAEQASAWQELAGRPVGTESRPARALAWRLYLDGAVDLRWQTWPSA